MLSLRYVSVICGMLMLIAMPGYGAQGYSGNVDDVSLDFSTISGYVVQQSENEYIIDLNASDKVSIGDIFSICSKGDKITHPVTGKTLGFLEKVDALLSITRVEPNYSFARLISGSKQPKRGDIIRRFEKMPAIFWDYTGNGREIFTRLRSSLNHLKWMDYAAAQKLRPGSLSSPIKKISDTLFFILLKNRFEVRGPDFEPLHMYGELLSTGKTIQKQHAADKEGSSSLKMTEPVSPLEFKKNSVQKVQYQESFPELQTMDNFAMPAAMADFVSTGMGNIMAATDGVKIFTYMIEDKSRLLSALELDHPGQILSLGWWQPMTEGSIYLAVNTWYDHNVWGYIFEMKEDRLISFQKRIPRILGTFDQDADGRPETLLAQEFDNNEIFGSRKWQGHIASNQITWSEPLLELPRQFNVIGSCFGDLTGDGRPETVFILNGKLFIYAGKKPLFKSSVRVGGSDSILTYDMKNSSQNMMSNSVVFEINPLLGNVDGKDGNELVVVSMERGLMGRISPGIGGDGLSTIFVFKQKNGGFVQGTLGGQVNGHIQGLDVTSNRVMMMVSQLSSVFKHGGKSSLLSFDLQQ